MKQAFECFQLSLYGSNEDIKNEGLASVQSFQVYPVFDDLNLTPEKEHIS